MLIKLYNKDKEEKWSGEDRKNKLRDALNNWAQEIVVFVDFLYHCHALMVTTTHSDYNDDELHKKGGEHSKQSKFNPSFKCETKGHDTQDYQSCVNWINVYDGFQVAKKVNTQAQSLRRSAHQADIQDQIIEAQEDDGLAGTSALMEGQKSVYQAEKQYAQERGALSGSELATLEGLRQAMPTVESLSNQCQERMRGKDALYFHYLNTVVYNTFVNGATNSGNHLIPQARQESELSYFGNHQILRQKHPDLFKADQACAALHGERWGINLVMNGGTRKAAVQSVMKAGIEAAAELAKAALLGDREDVVAKAKKEFEEFVPEDAPEIAQDATVAECEVNPEAPGCQNLEPQYHGMQGGTLTIGGTGTSSTINAPSGGGKSTASTPGSNKEGRGSKFATAKLDDPKGEFGTSGLIGRAPAAAYKDGPGKGPIPQGGGPNLGGVAPPGGPGGAGTKRGTAEVSKPKVDYKGSGVGSLTGYNRRYRPTKTRRVANPLASLFNKGQKDGERVVNFREPASNLSLKQDLFERLSERYQAERKKGYFLKYKWDEVAREWKLDLGSLDDGYLRRPGAMQEKLKKAKSVK